MVLEAKAKAAPPRPHLQVVRVGSPACPGPQTAPGPAGTQGEVLAEGSANGGKACVQSALSSPQTLFSGSHP